MWLDKEEISYWAYYYCKDIEDRPEIREHITDPDWAFEYCRYIEDRPEIRHYVNYYHFLKNL